MESEKEVALYYPHIDIADSGLVKSAALYWDKLQTIVPLDPDGLYSERKEPPSVTDFYKADASREAKKEGFLEERFVSPTDKSVEQTGQEFVSDLRGIPEIKESLANILRSTQWQRIRTERYRIIYMEKFNPLHLGDLIFELKETGVQFSPLTDGSNGMIVPKPFYDMYMSRMASVVSQNDNSAPLANENLWQNAALGRVIDYSQERTQNQLELVRLSLQTISINPNVPLIEVLRFRDRHRTDLLNYRRYIRKLARQISKGLSDDEREALFKEIATDEFLPAKEEIEAKLSEEDIAFGFSALDITQATAMGMIASQRENLLAGLGVGLISLTISFVQSLREDRHIIRDHPLGYLYRAEKKFGVKNKR